MRVTALGVNSAFSRGEYTEAFSRADVARWLTKVCERLPENGTARIGEGLRGQDPESLLAELQPAAFQAYAPRWQSNFLLEFDAPGKVRNNVFRLVIDCGGDIRHSLAGIGLRMHDIDAWYISHPHNDHIGGIEGIALSTLFHPGYTRAKADLLGKTPVANYLCEMGNLGADMKPDLIGHASVLDEAWEAANPGLRTIQGVEEIRLDTYFEPRPLKSNKNYSMRDGQVAWKYYTIVTTHVVAGRDLMPSYGLMFECAEHCVYFPTDTQLFMPPQVKHFYDRASVVYMDCETGFVSGVHPHIEDLRALPSEMKKKMWLYHYDDEPEYDVGEFAGTLRAGMTHSYEVGM
jgi:ribonuclease BN (tRNA processing enzyme)